MFSEQFIQDAISRPECIQRVMQLLGKSDWNFLPDKQSKDDKAFDVVNQEFNFSAKDSDGKTAGGRIDVIATFNRRTKLVLCEVKAGAVGDNELEQLLWYADRWRDLKSADPTLASCDEVVGILLAEDFRGFTRPLTNPNIHLFKFKMDGLDFPFSVCSFVQSGQEMPHTIGTFKHSQLITIESHRCYLLDPLPNLFDQFAQAIEPDDDARRQWLLMNPKSSHLAIHFKGHYIACVFFYRKRFDVGCGPLPGPLRFFSIHNESEFNAHIDEIKQLVNATMTGIDQGIDKSIPPGFNWRSFS